MKVQYNGAYFTYVVLSFPLLSQFVKYDIAVSAINELSEYKSPILLKRPGFGRVYK